MTAILAVGVLEFAAHPWMPGDLPAGVQIAILAVPVFAVGLQGTWLGPAMRWKALGEHLGMRPTSHEGAPPHWLVFPQLERTVRGRRVSLWTTGYFTAGFRGRNQEGQMIQRVRMRLSRSDRRLKGRIRRWRGGRGPAGLQRIEGVRYGAYWTDDPSPFHDREVRAALDALYKCGINGHLFTGEDGLVVAVHFEQFTPPKAKAIIEAMATLADALERPATRSSMAQPRHPA